MESSCGSSSTEQQRAAADAADAAAAAADAAGADTDSGRPASLDDDDEDEAGLVLRIPREEGEIKDQPGASGGGGAEIKDQIRRIPTVVCEDLDGDDQPSSSSLRRVQRALSKQCVVDDDTTVGPVQPSNIVIDTRTPTATLKKTPPAPTLPLTAHQWEAMADRRRELAVQLLGRTPLTLSQSEGCLERAKTASTSGSVAPKSGGNTKQLVRSHALCGDDDTRLRPPAEFARSNPSFAATKSLSRDSSATDYTDASGVDLFGFICSTLHKNEKDRAVLLDLERQLQAFLTDDCRQSYKFAPMSSYNRMLVHRVAAFFGLDHNIDQSGQCIVVNRSENTRVPEQSFASLIRPKQPYTDKRSLSRDAQSYEEIRDYPSLPHRMSLEMLSRRTRSFEVSGGGGHRTLSPAWRGEPNGQSTDSASSPYALSPVMQNNAEGFDEPPEALEARRRGVGQLHKAGSFGGVPVFYRNNSNGVRPVEEARGARAAAAAAAATATMGGVHGRSESQRFRADSQLPEQTLQQQQPMQPLQQPQPEYYGSGHSIPPPDPYYREEAYGPELNGNALMQQQQAYFHSDPNRQLYVDTHGAPLAPMMAATPHHEFMPYYYASPHMQPVQQALPYQQQQPVDQVDQLTREMSGASLGGDRSARSPSPPHQLLPQPAQPQQQRPAVPYFVPAAAAAQPSFYAPVYHSPHGYVPYEMQQQPVFFAPVPYQYGPAQLYSPVLQPVQPMQQPQPMPYNGTTYYQPQPQMVYHYPAGPQYQTAGPYHQGQWQPQQVYQHEQQQQYEEAAAAEPEEQPAAEPKN